MISVSGLTKHYGSQTLFEGVSMQFKPGERYGIVGANGCGKSTLLKILEREESPSAGDVSVPRRTALGVLKQDHFQYESERILDVVMMGSATLWNAMAEKERILARAEEHFDGDRYSELEDIILQQGGYTLEARAGEILEGLGIATAVHDQALSTLSGGFKLRVLLAQVLASQPDVLLLDEPTNHLDILSIRWLETFLEDYTGVALIVSHDHRFLDNVSTTILDIDYETLKAYPGNYQHFTRAKREERERREKEIQKREAKIAEQKAFVERFRAKATKARQAQSKLKAIDRIEIESLPNTSRRYPHFRFDQVRPSGRVALEIEDVSKQYGDLQVLDSVSLRVMRGERVAIIGPNGIGKSTLLKIAMGEVEAESGTCTWGYETHPGYVAQDQKNQIGRHRQTLEDWVADLCPAESIGFVRGHLGAVLFSGDEAKKKLEALSGGEAARLAFCKQIIQKPNVMVLDEPTNHLDLEAIESLVQGLQSYEGTLIFVSHDRWFVSQLATRIIEITPQGLQDFPGSYDEYVERCGDDHLDAQVVLRAERASKRKARAERRGKQPPPAKQGSGLNRNQLEQRLEQITEEIQTAETRIAELDQRFCAEDFYESTSTEQRVELESDRNDLSERLSASLTEWETLATELDALSDS